MSEASQERAKERGLYLRAETVEERRDWHRLAKKARKPDAKWALEMIHRGIASAYDLHSKHTAMVVDAVDSRDNIKEELGVVRASLGDIEMRTLRGADEAAEMLGSARSALKGGDVAKAAQRIDEAGRAIASLRKNVGVRTKRPKASVVSDA